MLKSRYEKNPIAYRPYDLLPAVNQDARLNHNLTPYQRQQMIKKLFWTETVVDEED